MVDEAVDRFRGKRVRFQVYSSSGVQQLWLMI